MAGTTPPHIFHSSFLMMFAALILAFAGLVPVIAGSVDVGDSLWKTFVHTHQLPTDVEGAKKGGYYPVGGCNPQLGVLYTQDKSGATEDHPLGLYFTSGGQIAGVQATVWGSGNIGNAAPDQLVQMGYWKPQAGNSSSWWISVSFREPSAMCDGQKSELLIGDRVVVNQDTIAKSIPLTEQQATDMQYDSGSCIKDMGRHYFLDVKSAPHTSFVEANLAPVVPMYNPATHRLHSFFFTTPVKQAGSNDVLLARHDWEAPALNPAGMCGNWCDDACTWATEYWSTMHIYLFAAWDGLVCPNGEGTFGRSCTF